MSPRTDGRDVLGAVPGPRPLPTALRLLARGRPLVFLVSSVWRSGGGRPAARGGRMRASRGRGWAGAMDAGTGVALAVRPSVCPAPQERPVLWTALGRATPWLVAGAGGLLAVMLGEAEPRARRLMAIAGAGANAGWIPGWSATCLRTSRTSGPAAWAGSGAAGGRLAIRRVRALWTAARGELRCARSARDPQHESLWHCFGCCPGRGARGMGRRARARPGTGGDSDPGRYRRPLRRARRSGVLCGRWRRAGSSPTPRTATVSVSASGPSLRPRRLPFASRPGLPGRALAFGLNQASVYEFHNSPAHQLYIDGRLEVASRATFENYVQIHRRLTLRRPRWANAVRRLGAPLILVDHEDNRAAEATLLADSRWRCIYQDAVAAIFLPRSGISAWSGRIRRSISPRGTFSGLGSRGPVRCGSGTGRGVGAGAPRPRSWRTARSPGGRFRSRSILWRLTAHVRRSPALLGLRGPG